MKIKRKESPMVCISFPEREEKGKEKKEIKEKGEGLKTQPPNL